MTTERPIVESARGLLAVGGPAFADGSVFASLSPRKPTSSAGVQPGTDVAAPSMASVATPASGSFRGVGFKCPGFQSIQFHALPGSRREAEDVAGLWRRLRRRLPRASRRMRIRFLSAGLPANRHSSGSHRGTACCIWRRTGSSSAMNASLSSMARAPSAVWSLRPRHRRGGSAPPARATGQSAAALGPRARRRESPNCRRRQRRRRHPDGRGGRVASTSTAWSGPCCRHATPGSEKCAREKASSGCGARFK